VGQECSSRLFTSLEDMNVLRQGKQRYKSEKKLLDSSVVRKNTSLLDPNCEDPLMAKEGVNRSYEKNR
jgi:hypothetical protein